MLLARKRKCLRKFEENKNMCEYVKNKRFSVMLDYIIAIKASLNQTWIKLNVMYLPVMTKTETVITYNKKWKNE